MRYACLLPQLLPDTHFSLHRGLSRPGCLIPCQGGLPIQRRSPTEALLGLACYGVTATLNRQRPLLLREIKTNEVCTLDFESSIKICLLISQNARDTDEIYSVA